jgi:hypothetical protein
LLAAAPDSSYRLELRSDARGLEGAVSAARRDWPAARAALEGALADYDAIGKKEGEQSIEVLGSLEATRDLARVLRAQGDRAAAAERLARALEMAKAREQSGRLPPRLRTVVAELKGAVAMAR